MNTTETKIKLSLRAGLVPMEPGQVIEGGNIIILSNSWVISHPVVIADPMFTHEPTKQLDQIEIGVLMIGDMIIEANGVQDIIEYRQKPRVVIRSGGVMQFVIQEPSYLVGKTQTQLGWELSVSPVPTRTILRVN